jgi:hypothetical protein
MRWIVALSTGLLLTGCLTAGPGGCSSEEAAAFNEIDHFGEQLIVPEDHPYGICGATFTSDVDPDDVVEHYQAALTDAGWTVGGTESSPITVEGGGQIGTSIGLSGAMGSMTFSLGAEILEDAEPTVYNVLVGESGS